MKDAHVILQNLIYNSLPNSSCVLPSSKRIYQKIVHLQLFDVIHLSTSDLTYIRSLERETKLCLCSFTSWKLASEPISVIYFFHPPTCLDTTMTTTRGAHIFTRWRLFFPKLPKIIESFAKLLEEYFQEHPQQFDKCSCHPWFLAKTLKILLQQFDKRLEIFWKLEKNFLQQGNIRAWRTVGIVVLDSWEAEKQIINNREGFLM
jgi:hypothetical protein